MNKTQFYTALGRPASLDEQMLPQLRSLVESHPYFQCGWMLYAKCLHNVGDIDYGNRLKQCAIRVPDRSRLFELMHETARPAAAPAAPPAAAPESRPPVPDYFSDVPDELPAAAAAASTDPLLDIEMPTVPYSIDEVDRQADAISENADCPFSDWLLYMGRRSQAPQPSPKARKSRSTDLIDSFLNKESYHIAPAEQPVADARRIEDAVRRSDSENESILTETLADIYIRQKCYAKAINIFEKLGLKYPEKSIYFADRIAQLKELTNNK